MMEMKRSSETAVLHEPHGLTFQEMAFFIVTAVETSNLTISNNIFIPETVIKM
jgi:hypothetical protein